VIPVIGDIYSGLTGIFGYDPLAGITLTELERNLAFAAVLPWVPGGIATAARAGVRAGHAALDGLRGLLRPAIDAFAGVARVPRRVAAWVGDAIARARGAGRAGDAAIAARGRAGPSTIRWGPHNGPGPLDKIETFPGSGQSVASTFRSSSYTEFTLTEPTTLYHVYGGESGPLSSYWTRTRPAGPLQSQLDLALNPAWGNTAEAYSTIRAPAGTRLFEGVAGPQPLPGGGSIPGGGNQIYIPRVDPDWLVR
jgi:Pre-toxin TG